MSGEANTNKVRVIVDTREQLPYTFNADTVEVVKQALPNGDYSLENHTLTIAVERKELNDYVQTIINYRDRFKRELRALQEYDAACIVVEGNLSDIVEHSYKSAANTNAVFGATTSIIVDYGIPIYFCGTRQIAREFTEHFLIRHWQRLERIENRRR